MRRRERRPLLLTGLAAILIPAAAYLFFELGRFQAGYAVLDRQREFEEFENAAAVNEKTIDELKRQLAILETSRNIDRETYAQVETSLTELEARLQAQEEELAFYRGIISPPDGVAGLRIQSLEIRPSNSEQRYTLRLVLMQAIVHNRTVTGAVSVSVTGLLDGDGIELALDELTADDAVAEIEYGFRYFQGLEQELVFPEGFMPTTVEVEIRPTEPKGDPVTRTFQWNAVSGESSEE